MSDKAAIIRAEFTDYRPVKTRKVLQLTFEVPAEEQTAVFAALGYPIMGTSSWVAIAKLTVAEPLPEGAPAPATPRIYSRSQIAALKCQDEEFGIWIAKTQPELFDLHYYAPPGNRTTPEACNLVLKDILEIESKSELDTPGPAQEAWDRLLATFTNRAHIR